MKSYLDTPAIVHSGIATSLLSSNRLLNRLLQLPFTQELLAEDMAEAVYLTFQTWFARQPDHIFQSNWRLFCSSYLAKEGHWVLPTLQTLVNEFLEFQHGDLHVTMARFGEWQQNILSRISALPIQAAAYAGSAEQAIYNRQKTHKNHMKVAHLLSPTHPLVEDYIEREGLHETHLHLNGSTHAESCWLKALYEPKSDIQAFSKQYSERSQNGARTRELCHSINADLSPALLYRHLLGARNIRACLIVFAYDIECFQNLTIPATFQNMIHHKEILSASSKATPRALIENRCTFSEELIWIQVVLERLQKKKFPLIDRLLHIYLLLQNQYYRLLVQSEEQYGFDQFQKLTLTNLRDPIEKWYLARFQQMHGDNPKVSRIGWLEGRFAPKRSITANQTILASVLGGYLEYLLNNDTKNKSSRPPRSLSKILLELDARRNDFNTSNHRNNHKLTLVAHFPKKQWNWKDKKEQPYRHYSLRRELAVQGNALIGVINKWPLLEDWITGIDAAANELHAPPEVFATIFRVCQRKGFTHRTYHVGEDFSHLISGLRHVTDALQLLNLEQGDRIGHGTAFGIAPSLWLSRMPPQLVITRGEWMLDLLCAWSLLHTDPKAQLSARSLEASITGLASYIFNEDISITCLEHIMRLRGLHAPYVLEAEKNSSWCWRQASLSDNWREEASIVYMVKRKNARALKLYAQWLTGENKLWERSEELISVNTNYLDDSMLLLLQQKVMKLISERNIVVETLPTSNVRISQYESFSEHHSLRWMKAPGYAIDGDPDIMISLGSDDPGIFANDLNGDFYQLYAVLQRSGILDKHALDLLATINERGRQYRFHKRS
ncbi:hypothetical protein ACOI9X_12245 [Pseudomonas sp. P2757]|uniref:hypothetical protein n=1 Tax=unclassified Pseudomonas TaxID=196821 RepID=UPI003B5AC57A